MRSLVVAIGLALLALGADPVGAVTAATTPTFGSSVNCRRGVLSVVIMPPRGVRVRRVEFYLGSKRVHTDGGAPFVLSTVPVSGPSRVLPEDGKVIKVLYPIHMAMKVFFEQAGHLRVRTMKLDTGACRPGSSTTA